MLFLAGAGIIGFLHSIVLALFGWPSVPAGVPVGVSIAHGFQWGLAAMLLLLVGAVLIGTAMAEAVRVGAYFFYGVFFAHAVFDYWHGGDPIDPMLYSVSAALVIWTAAVVFGRTLKE